MRASTRRAGRKAPVHRERSRLPRGAIGIATLAAVTGAAAIGAIPVVLAAACWGFSLVAYVMYWYDKRSAERGGRRTPENTLHLFDLLGGWPGALVAQQQFRHKTVKQPFQAIFWATVAANLAAAWWWLSSAAVSAGPWPSAG